MEKYGKKYPIRKEYMHRLGVFAKNMIRAAEHQALDPMAVHDITPFSDLSEEEFEGMYTGVRGGPCLNDGSGGAESTVELMDVSGLPESFDWREKGAVTEVKMQRRREDAEFRAKAEFLLSGDEDQFLLMGTKTSSDGGMGNLGIFP
ncbi:putative cathepsin F [Rosa chinensis]|uniref:Putative cathepsin F n=1 Tax=Rosa chinensis TaxID=74649 RepID=A0A2P6RA02_ROSCH|nr:probable cysteine protease RD19D [Rosa chinensis]PRQ43262.1 putative cathepsin F [Rosa chinensis]